MSADRALEPVDTGEDEVAAGGNEERGSGVASLEMGLVVAEAVNGMAVIIEGDGVAKGSGGGLDVVEEPVEDIAPDTELGGAGAGVVESGDEGGESRVGGGGECRLGGAG